MKGPLSPGSATRRNERQVTHRELTDAPDPPICAGALRMLIKMRVIQSRTFGAP